MFTLDGSNSAADPGWDTSDAASFTPLGSIDTGSLSPSNFTATELRAPGKGGFGRFRWIIWQTAPVTGILENTSWQEFSVECSRKKPQITARHTRTF